MGAQHGVLDGVVGVLGGVTAPPRHAVEPIAVTPEQLPEGVAVAGEMGVEQFRVAAVRHAGHGADINQRDAARHFTCGRGG